MSTWLITGCSTGLGRALAAAVLDRGWNAAVTARDPESLADLVNAHPETALPLALDVTDPAQVVAAVTAAEGRFGSIDVLVNNAGYGYRAAVEEGDEPDVQRLFATNVFGPVALVKAVLPGMRARRSGTIVNISSIGAQICPPGSGYYSATKAALEGLSASLRREVEPLGLRVVVVEPGAFRTDFSGRSITESSTVIDDYADTAGKRRKRHDRTDGTNPGTRRRPRRHPSAPSAPSSRRHCSCSATTPSAPPAASSGPGWGNSSAGGSSAPAPTSATEHLRTMKRSAAVSTPVRETTTLTNGVEMPMVGFGVHQNPSEQTTDAVAAALATGYRLVDTAAAQGNEDHRDRADSADPTLSAERTASRDAADPIEPTDRHEPPRNRSTAPIPWLRSTG